MRENKKQENPGDPFLSCTWPCPVKEVSETQETAVPKKKTTK